MKQKSLPSLKKKLWKIFSIRMRKKDADENGMVKCFTCPVIRHWTEMQAGHYVAQSLGLSLVFEERNVHAQCAGCNLYKRGNPSVYAIELRKRYGEGILEELQSLRKEGFKYSRWEYEELIEKYRNLNELT